MRIVISSGHGKYVRGAAGPPPWGLDEVNEARKVVEEVAKRLRSVGVEVVTYHDDVSQSQSENLDRICDFHNATLQPHDYDISVHFNAYEITTTKKMGVEALFVTQEELAAEISASIASVTGLPDRGPKYRSDLAFLNNTEAKACLIETLFCDAKLDCDAYRARFHEICAAIAESISGHPGLPERPQEPEQPPGTLFYARGPCSWFGGPDDTGVAPTEGLAFFYNVSDAPQLFLPFQPSGTTGLARRLNPWVPYVACRWDYDETPKEMLRGGQMALVRAHGLAMRAFPADWGPHEDTGRVADLSPGLLEALKLSTDDTVEVIYPAADDLVA